MSKYLAILVLLLILMYLAISNMKDAGEGRYYIPTLDNKRLITCKKAIKSDECGMHLSDCSNKIEYFCVHRVGYYTTDMNFEEAARDLDETK